MKKILSTIVLTIFLYGSLANAEEIVVAQVHGMVCEFCAVGLEKKFNECEEIESIDVSLEEGTVSLVLKEGQQMDDEKITKIITDNGIHVANIERNATVNTEQ